MKLVRWNLAHHAVISIAEVMQEDAATGNTTRLVIGLWPVTKQKNSDESQGLFVCVVGRQWIWV